MGGYPPHGTGTRGFIGPGGAATDREAPAEENRREVGVHLGGGGESAGGVWADGEIHLAKEEYVCAVYCYAIAYRTMWGGVEEAGYTGGDAVVVTGGHWPGGVTVDGGGGGKGGQGWSGGVKEGK